MLTSLQAKISVSSVAFAMRLIMQSFKGKKEGGIRDIRKLSWVL